MKSRHAFTLIELLVVVSIIALLISILLPALKGAREQTKNVVCKANISELAKGLGYYLEDNKRYYPGGHLQHSGGPYYAAWVPRIFKYLANERDVFNCPSITDAEVRFDLLPVRWLGAETGFRTHVEALGYELGDAVIRQGSQRPYYDPASAPPQPLTRTGFSYGYNESGSTTAGNWGRNPTLGLGVHVANWQMPYSTNERYLWEVHEKKVVKPDDMIVIADADADGVEDVWISMSEANKWPGDRHNFGANVLFGDLHVESIRQKKLVRIDEVELRRWNNDHDPHRDFWPPSP